MCWRVRKARPAVLIVAVAVAAVTVVVVTVAMPGFGHELEAAEQAMALTDGTGGEVERARDSGLAAVSKRQPPKAVYHDRPFMLVLEQALEFAGGVKRHDRPASEVADEQLVRMRAEVGRRERQAPRRVDLA